MRNSIKPPALQAGAQVSVVSPASPADLARVELGRRELVRLGYKPRTYAAPSSPDGYFASPLAVRFAELDNALCDADSKAVCCTRGGFGTTCLLEGLDAGRLKYPKIVLGYSDVSTLQIFLWQKLGWVTFYGPMVAAGFDRGLAGYDPDSFRHAVSETQAGWSLELGGEALRGGEGQGILLGGCLALVETTLGTPWELDTRGAILVLEDRGTKPYQVDRMLTHLKQAGKLAEVRGIVLGEMPDCKPPDPGGVDVRDVFKRILGELAVPVLWRVPFGHAARPILTLPLGVRARLVAEGGGRLDILEPAVSA